MANPSWTTRKAIPEVGVTVGVPCPKTTVCKGHNWLRNRPEKRGDSEREKNLCIL